MSELVQCLTEWLAGTGIGLLELRTPEHTIILRQDVPAAPVMPEALSLAAIRAPSLGVFLHSHPSSGAALVRPGLTVREGNVVGLLRIGALLLPVLAPHDCVIAEHLAEDGKAVGYGTPLIRLRTVQPQEGT